ncbi:HNH endonuclease signature motif containing protein [Georgenia alba]|uniref:DUF222 domain-containing protein n=1 Tax=Georgenia alba TaxID=2233858 RepID=A0ABW2Q6V5_9MICO
MFEELEEWLAGNAGAGRAATATVPHGSDTRASASPTSDDARPADARASHSDPGASPAPAAPLFSRFGLTDEAACRLESLRGGDRLAEELFGLEPAELSDAALLEAVAGFERLTSAAVAGRSRCLSELLARRGTSSRAADGVVDEVRARLGQTGVAAQATVGLAIQLEAYPEVADALAAGEVDARKAAVLVDRQSGVSESDHRALTKELLPQASTRTTTWLRDRIRSHALATDPEAGRLRREQEHSRRCVSVEALPDAMARVSAYLRGDDAQRVKASLDSLADAARTDGDDRNVDQRRADVFVDVLTGAVAAGPAEPAARIKEEPASGGLATERPGRSRTQLHVTVGAGTLLGLDEEPAVLAGHGPIPAELARELAADATWRGLFTDAAGQFAALGTRAYRPGVVLERTVKARHVRCTFPGCRQPARYTDLDHITAYDHARARDERTAPQTTEANLHPLCRRHHNLKTSGRWAARREGGALRWRAPTGHTYRYEPQPPPGARPPGSPPHGDDPGRPPPF